MLKKQLFELPTQFTELEDLATIEAEQSGKSIHTILSTFWQQNISNNAPDDFVPACEAFWSFYQSSKNEPLDDVNYSGFSPLHIAAIQGYDVYLKSLCNQLPAESLNPFSYSHCTPLHLAATYGNLACFKVLEEQGADLNALMNDGTTCLHTAASNGHADIVTYLLNNPKFTEQNAVAEHIGTALHAAVANGRAECVDLLLPKLKLLKDNQGNTPFHTCIQTNMMVLFDTLLPHYKADMNLANDAKRTPLLLAIAQKNLNMTNMILQNGGRCDLHAVDGHDAISMALKNYFQQPSRTENKMILDAVLAKAKADNIDLSMYQWHLDHLNIDAQASAL